MSEKVSHNTGNNSGLKVPMSFIDVAKSGAVHITIVLTTHIR